MLSDKVHFREWIMKVVQLILIVVVIFLITGCSKERENRSSSAATNKATQNPLTAPVDYLGAVGQAKIHAEKVLDITSVRQAIQMFYASEGRYPSTLEELVSSGYLHTLPQLPGGYRWDYNPRTGEIRVVRSQ
jgi:hypothetical protein